MRDTVKGLTILVSGASGFIGKNLVKTLLQNGAEVLGIVPDKESEIHPDATKIIYNGNYDSLKESLETRHIDAVVHLATLFLANHKEGQITDMINSNILFGTHLLEYTKKAGIASFIYATTYAVSIDHDTYKPQNLYAATKKALSDIIEYYKETSSTSFLTLELTDTYGPGDNRPKFINLAMNAIRGNSPFNMSEGEQEICYLFIDDAVSAFVYALTLLAGNEVKSGGAFSVYADEVMSLTHLVDYLQVLLGKKIDVNRGFYPYRDREIMTYRPGFARLPGWMPEVDLKEGVKRIIEYESNQQNIS